MSVHKERGDERAVVETAMPSRTLNDPIETEVETKSRKQRQEETEVKTAYHHIADAEKQGELEKQDFSRHISSSSSVTSPPASDHGNDTSASRSTTVVSFAPHDPENPYNWPRNKKLYCVFTCVGLVMNSTIGSSIASGGTQETAARFNLHNPELLVLPVSIYLVGYVLGPLIFPPISESYGRKWVMIATFVVFTAFVLGCALVKDFTGFIIMRLLVGIGASTPVSVIGGIFADVYNTPKARGFAMTGFMAATTWGPLIGPVMSGFIAPVSWPWIYWAELIITGATWPFLLTMPETFGPVILQRRAARLRKETGRDDVVAPADLEKRDLRELVVVVLTRPVRMFLFEPIVLVVCLYLAVAYGIFYIFFQAFPIVFEGIYNFNDGEEGLAFLPIGVGAIIATGAYLWWDKYLTSARARNPPPSWAYKEEFVRLPLACIGGPLFVVSLFWLGWTARADVPWIVPVLAALPFGIGFLLIFMSLINYIVDSYEVFAASAMGAASASRSIFGVVLPFAARPMYERLGVAWACTLLAFLSALMSIVPFVFIKYGPTIKARSAFCQELLQKKREAEERKSREEEAEASTDLDGKPTDGCNEHVHQEQLRQDPEKMV